MGASRHGVTSPKALKDDRGAGRDQSREEEVANQKCEEGPAESGL